MGDPTARKGPIGSTNYQWGWGKPPLIEISLYHFSFFEQVMNNKAIFSPKLLVEQVHQQYIIIITFNTY
ncbi:hypothetical protein [Metabacillus fastidiosus]|uniref:Uncharacterized protein n=1 Tax=Metabacillus fastidiosus TaxID=1458 RepID=A0ABU6P1V2_9BACI|nr:hypothetical protein [Metabacillus fastidiosus]MED4460695.1 hypothetical protein [Metabacillus fastidiosus]